MPKTTQLPNGNEKKKRPFLISAMIALAGISALILTGSVVSVGLTHGAEASGLAASMAFPLFTIFVGIAIGGLRGARYGWWALGTYSVYSTSKGLIVTLAAMALTDQLDPGTLTKQILYGFSLSLWGMFILVYVFRKNVREYFQVSTSSKMKQILILVGLFVLFLFVFLSQHLPTIVATGT